MTTSRNSYPIDSDFKPFWKAFEGHADLTDKTDSLETYLNDKWSVSQTFVQGLLDRYEFHNVQLEVDFNNANNLYCVENSHPSDRFFAERKSDYSNDDDSRHTFNVVFVHTVHGIDYYHLFLENGKTSMCRLTLCTDQTLCTVKI